MSGAWQYYGKKSSCVSQKLLGFYIKSQHSDKDGFCFHIVLKYQSEAYKIYLGIPAQGSSGILDVEAAASIVRCLQVCELGQKYSPVFNIMILLVET